MARSYLVDSNVVIDYLAGKFHGRGETILDEIFNSTFHYSVISRIEILGFNAPADVLATFVNFLSNGDLHYINENITLEIINIRRAQPKTKLPDAIIAATACVNRMTLLTRDTDDFRKIGGLNLSNPWDW